jgi:hypothetical protein
LARASAELAGQYSEVELKLIYEYTLKSIQLVREQTERIRALKVRKTAAK